MRTYNFNPNATKSQVKLHQESLKSMISYYENRGYDATEYKNELSASIDFYNS